MDVDASRSTSGTASRTIRTVTNRSSHDQVKNESEKGDFDGWGGEYKKRTAGSLGRRLLFQNRRPGGHPHTGPWLSSPRTASRTRLTSMAPMRRSPRSSTNRLQGVSRECFTVRYHTAVVAAGFCPDDSLNWANILRRC